MDHEDGAATPVPLHRTLSLPLLVFYGLGVTIGAGIFALIGIILEIAGDQAPLSFLLAGAIAGATGLSYALLVKVYPKAGGEAVFVNRGLGSIWGRMVGYGVVVTGIVSSAVIALAFAGYARVLLPLPAPAVVIGIVVLLATVAWYGVRQSVIFAAIITVMEIGTLIVIIIYGTPAFADGRTLSGAFAFPISFAGLTPIFSAAVIAFFAFIGFEDIENMIEETVDPVHTAPRAIFWTLGITLILYLALSLVAIHAVDREAITSSEAPMAVLFQQLTGLDGQVVAGMAGIAMINGILVQILMASRVLYGMANEGLAPRFLSAVDPVRRTPARATFIVSAIILSLALFFPIVRLAEFTSLITLSVFTLVNLSLFGVAVRVPTSNLGAWRWWGLFAATICLALVAFQIWTGP